MKLQKPLAVGIDDFEKIITKGYYYYVDKTLLIKELLDKKGEVTLFTRPRHFGKTLSLSMLRYFFEATGDEEKRRHNRALFSGLVIERAGEDYLKEMGQYPVICVTLKSTKQRNYSEASACLKEALAEEFVRHEPRVVGRLLNLEDRDKYMRIRKRRGTDNEYLTSLAFLSRCLFEAYQKKCIILIDEYDVPLENAYYAGFYEQMSGLARSLFESALKSIPCPEFAVITGCLRISRESIFTGLNNLAILSIMSNDFDEYFGFVQDEVDAILEEYNLCNCQVSVKQWYDGYLFGKKEIYNPWSILCYVREHVIDRETLPVPFWANTSSNSVVRDLVERLNDDEGELLRQLEYLMNGGTIEKAVHEDITYDSIYDSEDNLWNFLFFTGYLKKVSVCLAGEMPYVTLAIPNREVSYIYSNTIHHWFEKKQRGFCAKTESTVSSPTGKPALAGRILF